MGGKNAAQREERGGEAAFDQSRRARMCKRILL